MTELKIILFKDYGSDAKTGIITVVITIIVYVIWFAIDSDSALKSMEGDLKQGEKGFRTERNRKKRHNTRSNQINRMKQVTAPNNDGKYLYIFHSNGLYKIGISTNPEYRRKQVQKRLNNSFVSILFVGKVKFGRTIDTETIIHRELSLWNEPVYYNDSTISPEWFYCSIGKILSITQQYADMKAY